MSIPETEQFWALPRNHDSLAASTLGQDTRQASVALPGTLEGSTKLPPHTKFTKIETVLLKVNVFKGH